MSVVFQEEKKEVLREHLEECLKHFGKWFNSKVPSRSHNRSLAMQPMVEFLGVTLGTVQRMLDDLSSLPRGEIYIKLMCYLDLHGYKIIEFERMSKSRRNFSELIGFDILSPQTASNLLGYHDAQQIYQVLSGREGVSKKKEDLMWNIWKEKRIELDRRKKDTHDNGRLEILFKVTDQISSSTEKEQLALPASSEMMNTGVKQAVLNILENSLLLIDGGFFEDLSDGELGDFSQSILRLLSRLNALSLKVLEKKVG